MRWYFLFFILLASCEKYHVSVRSIPVNAAYLASSHVGTPDPRQAHPPLGQKLVIDWAIPPEMLIEQPKIILHLLYKNHVEKEVVYPITCRGGYVVYSLLNEEFTETKGLLTYRAEIVTEKGEVYREWKHQLWVNLITLEERQLSAARMSDSVVSQSIQGSVIDTAYLREEGLSDKN